MLPVAQFPILSFQQANPLLTGMQAGSGMLSSVLQNAMQMQQLKYLPQQMQAALGLKLAQAQNQQAQAQKNTAMVPYYGAKTDLTNQQAQMVIPQAQANIAEKYAQAGLAGQRAQWVAPQAQAQIGLDQARTNQANVTAQSIPFRYSPQGVAALTAAKQGVVTDINQWNKNQQDAANSANAALQVQNLLDQAKTSYDKLNGFQKGAVAGGLHPLSSDAQIVDSSSNQIAALLAKTLFPQRVTNVDFSAAQKMKPNRAMNPAAFEQSYDYFKQLTKRAVEEPAFMNAAKSLGIDSQTANTLWQSYNTDRPLYDFANKKPNTQYDNSWHDYLTPQAIAAARTGKNYAPSQSAQKSGSSLAPPSQEDLIHTAQKYGLTVDQVKQKLGIQ